MPKAFAHKTRLRDRGHGSLDDDDIEDVGVVSLTFLGNVNDGRLDGIFGEVGYPPPQVALNRSSDQKVPVWKLTKYGGVAETDVGFELVGRCHGGFSKYSDWNDYEVPISRTGDYKMQFDLPKDLNVDHHFMFTKLKMHKWVRRFSNPCDKRFALKVTIAVKCNVPDKTGNHLVLLVDSFVLDLSDKTTVDFSFKITDRSQLPATMTLNVQSYSVLWKMKLRATLFRSLRERSNHEKKIANWCEEQFKKSIPSKHRTVSRLELHNVNTVAAGPSDITNSASDRRFARLQLLQRFIAARKDFNTITELSRDKVAQHSAFRERLSHALQLAQVLEDVRQTQCDMFFSSIVKRQMNMRVIVSFASLVLIRSSLVSAMQTPQNTQLTMPADLKETVVEMIASLEPAVLNHSTGVKNSLLDGTIELLLLLKALREKIDEALNVQPVQSDTIHRVLTEQASNATELCLTLADATKSLVCDFGFAVNHHADTLNQIYFDSLAMQRQ